MQHAVPTQRAAGRLHTRFTRSLFGQVLIALALGTLLGLAFPEFAAKLKPLGDGFIKLIKMVIAPIIFCTVVSGIAGMQSMKSVGKTGGYALLYFEIVSTIALLIGLVVVNVVQPGIMPTDMAEEAAENFPDAVLDMHPIRRIATLEEVAAAVSYLVGPAAGYTAGTVIDVSGGVLA